MSVNQDTISNYKVLINPNTNSALDIFNWNFYTKCIKFNIQLKDIYVTTNLTRINENVICQGFITRILDKEALVNLNYKTEGIINLNEVIDKSKIQILDSLDVMVDNKEYKGQLMFSYRKANILKAWVKAKKSYKNGEIIKGKIIGLTKGGMIVKILEYIEAFMPGSQIDNKPISNFERYFKLVSNKTMEFKILKISHKLKNIVVSHKAFIEGNIKKKKNEILSKFSIGQVIKARIKKITVHGLFCDLGGLDGLVHYTDIYWKRRNHPSEILNLYDVISVLILDYKNKKQHVLLGIKQLRYRPWYELYNKYTSGDKVSGVVTSITQYGAFIELINHPGVEAILHVSEMSWSSKLRLAKYFVKRGDLVECVILKFYIVKRKMSLGRKQLTPDPWINISKKYSVGSIHTGKIINLTISGVFIQLDKGVDGMIHHSYISKYASNLLHLGNLIDVIVLEVYYYYRRLILLSNPKLG